MAAAELSLGVNTFVALIAVALLLSVVAERARIPAAVLLVGAGILVGSVWHVRPPFAFSEALLFIFLPPLIFEAAWNVHADALRRTWRQIVLLAFPGTLIVAFAIAGGIMGLRILPFGAALLFGAMVAATDPVAVIAVFRKFAVPDNLKTIIEAESISNDGVAVVLYSAALTLAMGGAISWPQAAAHGILAIVGAIAIGGVLSVAAWWLLRATHAAEHEVTMTLALAYIAYLVADRLAFSGIFACASAGVVLRMLHHRDNRAIMNVEHIDRFWSTTAYLANGIVFIATGLLIDFTRIAHEPRLIGVAIVIVFASRAGIVTAVLRGGRERVVAFLAGMRGALPLALALALPSTLPHRSEIIDAVFATVFVTLVIQGLPLEAVVRRLYPETQSVPSES